MMVDLFISRVRPFGTGMSSNSLRCGRGGDDAQAVRVSTIAVSTRKRRMSGTSWRPSYSRWGTGARFLTWLIGVLAARVGAAALGAAHVPLLRGLGQWLVVEDALARADAIVVVAGSTPTNEEAGAALYRAGWAPRVILSRPATPARRVRLMELGVRPLDLQG